MDTTTRWRPLFDGHSLDGWSHVGDGGFEVVDGCLRTRGGMGLLWYTRDSFADCVLRVVFRTRRPEDNSGVFIRIDGPPADAWHAVHHGYEVQVLAAGDEWHRSGVIYSMTRTADVADRPTGQWNDLQVTLDGPLVRVRLNDIGITDFDPEAPVPPRRHDYEPAPGPRPWRGYIGLQNHDDASVVDFREVSVRALADDGT